MSSPPPLNSKFEVMKMVVESLCENCVTHEQVIMGMFLVLMFFMGYMFNEMKR